MAKPLYFLLFAVILFTSCKDEEVPQSYLNGTYELAGENTDTGNWGISRYVFGADGTYERFGIRRESEDGEDLGYSNYSKGTYSLRGEEFITQMTESSFANYEEYPDGYAENLNDLEAQEMSAESVELKGTLKRLDSGEKISILFECNDMLPGMLSNCIGEQVYDRVD